jgi:CTP synthase
MMVIEFGRFILQTEDVNSSEFDHATANPVIDLMPDQQGITEKGGTMRLGLYPCVLQKDTIAQLAYGKDIVEERHRHRFEFNNNYRQLFTERGMVFSGLSPDGRLVEIAEFKDHPFMLGTQFHPEFLSRPTRPHPLFVEFIRAACKKAGIKYNAIPEILEP